MDIVCSHAKAVLMLPCRSLTRLAISSKSILASVLNAFAVLCSGTIEGDPEEWHCLNQAERLNCFVQWIPPIARASFRFATAHHALWRAAPLADGKGRGKGKDCVVDFTQYHHNLSLEDRKKVNEVSLEETGRHSATRHD